MSGREEILNEANIYYTRDEVSARERGWARMSYRWAHVPSGASGSHFVFCNPGELATLLDCWNDKLSAFKYSGRPW